MFCPKCKSLLKLKKEKNKKYLYCSCGYKEEKKEDLVVSEKMQTKSEIQAVEKETPKGDLVRMECPKCGHMECYNWSVQTRAGDEAETMFFKCAKCGHTWREYD